MNIIVVGTGYVGLVTGACLATKGNHVICVDKDQTKLDKLAQGILPIYEPGLDKVVHDAVTTKHLSFTDNVKSALKMLAPSSADQRTLIFIAVGTPQGEDGSADLKYVLAVAREIGQELQQPAIIINKSTVPVGTADLVKGEIAWQLFQRKTFLDFDVVSNPEFLKEGVALDDFFNPDRIVVGTDNPIAKAQMSALYLPFVAKPEQLMIVGIKEAELIKYAANAMLATRISFMNEVANVCDRFGIDVEQVRSGVGADSRIGPAFLKSGCGYGGSCFPKDVQALVRIAQSVGVDPLVLNAVEARNKKQKQYLFQNITARFGANLHGRQFAVWGLAFKPDTDDMREASSIDLIRALTTAGAKVIAHDPVAEEMATSIFSDLIQDGKLQIAHDPMTTLANADALVLVTEWKEYQTADFAKVKASLKSAIVFDGRNHLPMNDLKKLNFEYIGVGRR
jgi:UDPglucose 6-dehydrogenase